MNCFAVFKDSVTLLADISAEDRFYLQNEANKEMNRILIEKKCKINLNLSSNFAATIDATQVSITGPPDGVCDAYLEIRQLIPITVWFDLKPNPNLPSMILDPNAQPLHDIQKKYEMAICVVPVQSPVIQPTPSNHISIYIRTNRKNEEKLRKGIEELTQFIKANNFGTIYANIQTKIDVPSNQPTIIGRTYSVLEPIAAKTLTQISVQKSPTNHMSNVSIVGINYPSISSARTEISDRFVVEVNFDVNAIQSNILEKFGRHLERMGEESGVHILMKPGLNPTNKVVIIRGTDKDVYKLFEVRQSIISILQNPPNPSSANSNGTTFVN